ncbi:MAG: glycine cleavage system aminomethyltransferase GcvT [Alphaproteobacteria bacterium]|nr:glycine cleavage system aminomethyltransferase GcvT [Alphaproteobacteria bacterium]
MATAPDASAASLKSTPLHALHKELGARMVPFAGYEMPVQYPAGIIAEHSQTRTAAGLFDVSHMGQAVLRGDDPAAAFERLVPGDISGLAPGAMRYTLLLNEAGGILDDLMVTRPGEPGTDGEIYLVVNAAGKDADFAHIGEQLTGIATLERAEDRALLALQGPQAAAVMARLAPASGDLVFMRAAAMTVGGIDCFVSRSGYTGEDGFEISLAAEAAEDFARRLLAEPEVEPVGLGARDSLRLEAGLCLYGHDIDATTTPVEAALVWAVAKARRDGGGFPGADVILEQIANGAARRRVGLLPEGRAPVREGAAICDSDGNEIGQVTSGGFSPTLERPIAMGYVTTAFAEVGTEVVVNLRGRTLATTIAAMPFVEANYYRGN